MEGTQNGLEKKGYIGKWYFHRGVNNNQSTCLLPLPAEPCFLLETPKLTAWFTLSLRLVFSITFSTAQHNPVVGHEQGSFLY